MSTDVLLNIYIKYPSVNIMRIITGEGDVLLTNEDSDGNDISLSYAINRCRQLEKENKELLLQVGELKGRIMEIKKTCPGGRQCNMCKCKRVRFGEIEYVLPKY